MRACELVLVAALVGCTGQTVSSPVAEPTDPPGTGAANETDAPTARAPDLPDATWRLAWPVGEDHSYVPGRAGAGRLLGPDGLRSSGPPTACGDGSRYEGTAVLWAPDGPTKEFLPAPRVTAALVERAAWRLAEVAPETTAIVPGVEAPDPAIHRGIRVRSVRKIRRQGPPFQIVLGERDDQVLIAITDRDAKQRVGGLVLQRSSASPLRFGVVPPVDLDGDALPEFVVYGDGDAGSLRAVVTIDLLTGELSRRSFEEHAPLPACPEGGG